MIRLFSVPFLFMGVRRGPQLAIVGGSALLWETIEGRFIVTASHVWTELEELCQKYPEKRGVIIGDTTRPILLKSLHPVDFDERLDLAVLASPELKSLSLLGKAFYRTRTWPQAPVSTGEMVAFFGFPGECRYVSPTRIELNSIYLQEPCVVSESGRTIWMYPQGQRTATYHASIRKPKLRHLGGVSGAPVFVLRCDGPEWIGIIRSGSWADPLNGTMLLMSSTLIGADGRLIRR